MEVDLKDFGLNLKENKNGVVSFSNRGSRITSDPVIMGSTLTQPVNGNNLYNMVVDCDEVLVDINKKLFTVVKDTLPQYFTPDHLNILDFEINLRKEYYFENWLGITNRAEADNVLDRVNQDKTFYDDLLPTTFFESLSHILTYVGQLHIVTKIIGHENDPLNLSKKRFLVKYFKIIQQQNPDVKLYFHFLQPTDSKIDYINKNSIDFNTFIDDQDKNILEVISKSKMRNFEVLCPLLGYNHTIPEKLKTKFADEFLNSGASFRFYHGIDHIPPEDMNIFLV